MNLPKHKAGLTIAHQPHKGLYESVEEHLNKAYLPPDFESEAEKKECIETDSLWTIQWYPDTPVGFISLAAPTLEKLLSFAQKVESEGK